MGLLAAQTILYEMKEPKLLENEPHLRNTLRVQCPYCGYVQLAQYSARNRKNFPFLFPRFCGICGREYMPMENQVSLVVEEFLD